MDPNFDQRTDVNDVNVVTVNLDTPCKPPVPSALYQKVECVFLSKYICLRSLFVLSVGLKNVDSVDLIDLEVDPRKSLPVNTKKNRKMMIMPKRLVVAICQSI